MKRTDIERMISLADDMYIDEIFQDKITGKRKNIFVTFTAVAAALAVVAGGISYFVSNADKSNDITTDMPAVSNEDITDNTETEPTMQAVSSSDFFKNKSDYPASFYIEWSSEFNGDKQMSFDETYVKTILPFSAEGYSKTRDQFYVFTDENDKPFGASVYFESPFDENASPKFKSISVNVCDKGKFSYPFPIEEFEPINYMHTDIYGFDDIDNFNYSSGVYESVLTAYFTAGGSEYSVSTTNLSAEETMQIVESLIQSGFSAKDFDLSMGGEFEHETTILNFDTANSTEPFAGYVPMVDGLFYLYNDGVTYCTEKMNGKLFSQYMAVVYYDGTEGDGKRVMLEYYTSGWVDKTPFDNVTDLMSVSRKDLGNFMADGEYKFTIKCDGFNINVTAKCGHDELWTYIDAIKGNGGASSDTNSSDFDFTPFCTLEKANNLGISDPFAGYVPTAKEIGDLKIYTGGGSEVMSAETEENGRVLKICYQSDVTTNGGIYGGNDFKAISTMYTEKKYYIDTTDPVISAEQAPFADLDELKTDGVRPDGRVCYRFIIDCGTCYITVAADCLPEEMRDYLMYFALAKQLDPMTIDLDKAKAVEPFGVYVPEKESSVLRLQRGHLGYYYNAPYSLSFVFSDNNNYNNFLRFYYRGDNVYFSAVPAENIIPIENIDWNTVDNFVKNNTTFLLDCGNVKIKVEANCTTEQAWFYIEQIKNSAMFDAAKKDGKLLTIDKIKELAQKGDDLIWDDFDDYVFSEGGSGLYIRMYPVEGGYT
ncbi:MAG: hypothetical protein K2K44_08795, partial [Oscillospiraceae bacterium]|nr:hypothetical protein [Oscillospiraceae bacterium]